MTERRRGVVEMSAAMLISGTIGWFVLQSGQPVIDIVFWRCTIGAVTLAAICAAMGLLRRDLLDLRRFAIAVLGGLAIVANWLLLFAAYPYVSISIATTVYNTQPFILLGLGALFLGERITLGKLFWLGIAFAGVALIAQAKPQHAALPGGYGYGILLALAAAFFYALAALAAKGLKGTPPHLVALIQTLTGAVLLAPFAGLSALPHTPQSWAMLATLGIVHTGLMYILLYGAIQKLPVHLTGALSFIYPVATLAVDRIAFGHLLQPMQIAGIVLVLGAAAATTLGWTWRRPHEGNARWTRPPARSN